jgi:TolA-binding protein
MKKIYLLSSIIFLILIISCGPAPREETPSNGEKPDSTSEAILRGKIQVTDTTNLHITLPEEAADDTTEEIIIEKPPPSEAFKSSYDYALRLYNEEQDYERAIEVFKILIQEYSNNDLTDNCQFWIGASYYNLGEHEKALIEFNKVHLYYPNPQKAKATQEWIDKIEKELNAER